jgi:hypothetical protein
MLKKALCINGQELRTKKTYIITLYTVIKDQKNKKFYVKDIRSCSYDKVYSLDE